MLTTNTVDMARRAADWRRGVLASLLTFTLSSVGAPEDVLAADPSTYAVTAARSSSVDIALSRPFVVDMGRTALSGSGSFAGYYVQPLDRDPGSGVGALVLTRVAVGKFAPVPVPLGGAETIAAYARKKSRDLPAGRYRIHVLGDAATTVRLRLRGAGASRSLRGTRNTVLRAIVRDATPTVAGEAVAPVAATDHPFTAASANSLNVVTLFAAYHAPTPGSAQAFGACLSPPGVAVRCHAGPYVPGNVAPDDEYGSLRDEVTTPIPHAAGSITYAVYYWDSAKVAGERSASYLVRVSGVLDRFVVGAFSLAY